VLAHYTDFRQGSKYWPWRNFTPLEMACKCCGEVYYDPEFMNGLQGLRDEFGALKIASAHRCRLHNARIGGAAFSQHLKLACDIELAGHDRFKMAKSAKSAGFKGRGYYITFLHLDMGRERFWYGKGARKSWE